MAFELTRAVLPVMLAVGKGATVNTASEASLQGSAAGAAYTASKHGIADLVKNTAVLYRDKSIRINAIAPSATATVIHLDSEETGPKAVMAHMNNMGRAAEADEQAVAILFLAFDAASNVSGVVLPVDNRWSAV